MSLRTAHYLLASIFLFNGQLNRAMSADKEEPQLAELRVGIDEGDLRGKDNRVLQAAVDRLANLGGGIVHIGPGRYLMRNALTLSNNIHVKGVPGKTVLVACDGLVTKLAVDGDCNERQVTLDDPAGFQVGDGISVQDKSSGGFYTTTATLTARVDAKTFKISRPLYNDYLVSNQSTARLVFPVVGGWNVSNASVEGLTIDGNKAKAQELNGCRGGGIYLFECDRIVIRDCVVRDYHGDGISFQVSGNVTVEDCTIENNQNLGIHPGSGSQKPIVRRNKSLNNGSDGLFVCWRVRNGLFEDNELRGNQRYGVCIGHKDSDNLFRNNTIINNAQNGVYFRNEAEPMGAHRNVFEKNVILDNGLSGGDKAPLPCIVLRGHHNDVVFRDNTIGFTRPASGTAGVWAGKFTKGLDALNNQFKNVEVKVQPEK